MGTQARNPTQHHLFSNLITEMPAKKSTTKLFTRKSPRTDPEHTSHHTALAYIRKAIFERRDADAAKLKKEHGIRCDLTREQLTKNKRGEIVSKIKHDLGVKNMKKNKKMQEQTAVLTAKKKEQAAAKKASAKKSKKKR